MESLTVSYIVPLFLGMTFDARTSTPGVDIYDAIYVDKPNITEFETVTSTYKIITCKKDVQEALNIDGDISLKIKTGMLDIAGKGAYIKNEVDFSNKIEILTTLKYISKVKSFHPDAKPRDGWVDAFNPGVLGTHYVSEVIYGAELIASLKFVVFNSNNTEDIKGQINAAFGAGSNGTDLVAEGKLENLKKDVQGKANIEISYYGTVPIKKIANDINGLENLINNFKDQVTETNLKDGIPMSVKLTSLKTICDPKDADKFKFVKNSVIDDAVKDFEEKFDELRQARLNLVRWAKSLPYDIKPNLEEEIGSLVDKMSSALTVFYDAVWNMDMTKGPEQFQKSEDAYNYDGHYVYKRYDKSVRILKNKLTPLIEWDNVAGDTYIQWGSDNCTAPGTEVLYKGFAISSTEEGIGGAASYVCISGSGSKGYDLSERDQRSHLSGIRYTHMDRTANPFIGPNARNVPGNGIPCAKCFSPDSAAVTIFPAADICPMIWEPMYKGYLVSSREREGFTTEYICVDEFPSEPYKMDESQASRDTAALAVIRSGGSLPKTIYPNDALVKCIVCSVKSNQVNF